MLVWKYRQIPSASLNASLNASFVIFPCVNAARLLFCLALHPHVLVVSSSCTANEGSLLIVSSQWSGRDKGVVTSWFVAFTK